MSNSKKIRDEVRKARADITNYPSTYGSLTEDTICRVAYPSYRVFIFGQEVTEDVIAVRLSQSGGSAERAAGSCAITLVNKNDRYIYNHDDMVKIAKAKAQVTASAGPSSDPRGLAEVVLNIDGRDWTAAKLQEFAGKLKTADADETSYWLQAMFGEVVDNRAEADALARKIIQFVDESSLGVKLDYDSMVDLESSIMDSTTKSDVKSNVLKNKLWYTTCTSDANALNPSISKADNPKTRVTFDYPMYEGDCIFNPNDPVRVAFRDPFDPLVWYWMFAGFVDSFTEEFSEDQESIISLTCTDVSKILRYSTLQTNLGVAGRSGSSTDENISSRLKEIYGFSEIENYISDAGAYFTSSMFESLTTLEILEVLFYGNESAVKTINSKYTLDLETEISELIVRTISSTLGTIDDKGNKAEPTSAAVYDYMINVLNYDPAEAKEVIRDYSALLDSEAQVNWQSEISNVLQINLKDHKLSSLNKFNFPALTFPGNVQMKKRADGMGVSYYILGKPDIIDTALGAVEIKNLKDWNDVIHHRVRKSDLDDMYNPAKDQHKSAGPSGLKEIKTKYLEVQDIITLIGTNMGDYPVGGGKLFFLSFSQVEEATERSILDRSLGGPGMDIHSSYMDRLTLLYDLAKNIDFRFYATPRGDFVFELPFYDFDPGMFWESDSGLKVASKSGNLMADYESIFTEAYTGIYNEDEAHKGLTGLQFLINSETGLLESPLQGYGDDLYYNYEAVFNIGNEDMISFSNTLNDQGMVTVAVAKPNLVGLYNVGKDLAKYYNAYAAELIPRLGVRVAVDDTWNAVASPEAAKMVANLTLNLTNSNCRNCGIRIIPRFGMMVNRPIWWRFRNQFGNIISVDHSINWNSDASTNISINNVRAWNGTVDSEGNYVHQKFGGETAFNWKDLVMRSGTYGTTSSTSANVQNIKNDDKNSQPSYDYDFTENTNPEDNF